jgi:hypothetical protein
MFTSMRKRKHIFANYCCPLKLFLTTSKTHPRFTREALQFIRHGLLFIIEPPGVSVSAVNLSNINGFPFPWKRLTLYDGPEKLSPHEMSASGSQMN